MSQTRAEFLDYIITGAVEGGTGYWAEVAQYQYRYDGDLSVYVGSRVGDGTRATLVDIDDGNIYELTPEVVERGINRIMNGEVGVAERIRQPIADGDHHNDAGDIDADCADAIAQAGLLGELRYG